MKYIAKIVNVREVTLYATADGEIWAKQVEQVGLFPWLRDGRAELIINAIDATWMAKRFREMVVAVSVCHTRSAAQADGVYLACAFHSSRFFGWVERNVYKMPHRSAAIQLHAELPVSMESKDRRATLLHTSMGSERMPSRDFNQDWEVPIYLPSRRPKTQKRNVLHAHIAGDTEVYPFEPSRDTIAFNAEADDDAIRLLSASDVKGHEWHVRPNATHARTATFSQPFDAVT